MDKRTYTIIMAIVVSILIASVVVKGYIALRIVGVLFGLIIATIAEHERCRRDMLTFVTRPMVRRKLAELAKELDETFEDERRLQGVGRSLVVTNPSEREDALARAIAKSKERKYWFWRAVTAARHMEFLEPYEGLRKETYYDFIGRGDEAA